MYPKSFQNLIESLRKLPQVGAKAAERYAYSIFEMSDLEAQTIIDSIAEVKKNVKECLICHYLTDNDKCDICLDQSKDDSIICVVNSSKDVIAMEKTGQFNGRYHVLTGEISPKKGIMPQDLTIDSLISRITPNIKEIILATNTTVEGETTAMYLKKVLANKDCIVTRLAFGIPVGGQLDYADELTLSKAIEKRTNY